MIRAWQTPPEPMTRHFLVPPVGAFRGIDRCTTQPLHRGREMQNNQRMKHKLENVRAVRITENADWIVVHCGKGVPTCLVSGIRSRRNAYSLEEQRVETAIGEALATPGCTRHPVQTTNRGGTLDRSLRVVSVGQRENINPSCGRLA